MKNETEVNSKVVNSAGLFIAVSNNAGSANRTRLNRKEYLLQKKKQGCLIFCAKLQTKWSMYQIIVDITVAEHPTGLFVYFDPRRALSHEGSNENEMMLNVEVLFYVLVLS